AGGTVKNHHANRVRADIDHANPAKRPFRSTLKQRASKGFDGFSACGHDAVHRGSSRFRYHAGRVLDGAIAALRQSIECIKAGTSRAPAEPRPDNDGFSIKNL